MEGARSDDFAGFLAALGKPTTNNSPTQTNSLNNAAAPPQHYVPQQFMWQPTQGTFLNNQPMVPQLNQTLSSQHIPQQMQSMMPQQIMHQQTQPQYFQYQAIPNQPHQMMVQLKKESIFKNSWIIASIIVIILVALILVWIQLTKMNSLAEDDEVEEKIDNNIKFRETERNDTREIPPPSSLTGMEDDDESEFVASNLLKYVNEFSSKEVVDISGQDIPLQYGPPSPTVIRHQPSKRIVADESEEVDAYAKKRAALFSNSNDEGRI